MKWIRILLKRACFFIALFFLSETSIIGQQHQSQSIDTTVIPKRRMPQHTKFVNGTYHFPAKPRNQWEFGVKGGSFQVSGDLPAKVLSPGFGAHIRKAFGYLFSIRLEYMYGIGKGQHWRVAENFRKNTAWSNNGYFAPYRNVSGVIEYTSGTGSSNRGDQVFYNYKSVVQDLSLQGVVTLNNIRFHKRKSGMAIYGFAGISGSIYDTKVNALNGNAKYDFNQIAQASYKNRKDKLKDLKEFMDDTYETPAENQGERRPKLFGNTFRPSGTIGFGVAIKLNRRINIAIEDRWTFVKDDLLDGQRWQEHAWGDAALTRDHDSYNFMSIGLNFNIGRKATEPLWWVNPLDYAYQEIRNPQRMNLPTPVLQDSDKDGIADQFDKEQTPEGCPVDSHGVLRDTDGDGVPDCKDKELITPTKCQPVDANGVGKCPEVPGLTKYNDNDSPVPDTDKDGINDKEDRCPVVPGVASQQGCPEITAEVVKRIEYAAKNIYFNTSSTKLLAKSNVALNDVVKILKEIPSVKLKIDGHTDNQGLDAYNLKLSDGRAAAAKAYLVSKGIDESRLVSEGFGETVPVADNNTAAGRQQNRRVEMKLFY